MACAGLACKLCSTSIALLPGRPAMWMCGPTGPWTSLVCHLPDRRRDQSRTRIVSPAGRLQCCHTTGHTLREPCHCDWPHNMTHINHYRQASKRQRTSTASNSHTYPRALYGLHVPELTPIMASRPAQHACTHMRDSSEHS